MNSRNKRANMDGTTMSGQVRRWFALIWLAAGEHWRQPSVWGSLFAVYAGAATPDQTRGIVRYCLEHDDLFVCRGQVRHLPKGIFWGKPEPKWVPDQKLAPQ